MTLNHEESLFQSALNDLDKASELRPERGTLMRVRPLSRIKCDDPPLGAFLEQLSLSPDLMNRLQASLFNAMFTEGKSTILYSPTALMNLLKTCRGKKRRTVTNKQVTEFRNYLVGNGVFKVHRAPNKPGLKLGWVIELSHPSLIPIFESRFGLDRMNEERKKCIEIFDRYVEFKEKSSAKNSGRSFWKSSVDRSAESSEKSSTVDGDAFGCGAAAPQSPSLEPHYTDGADAAVSEDDSASPAASDDVNSLPVIDRTERAAEELRLARPLYDSRNWIGLSERDAKFLNEEIPRLERHQPLKGKKIKWLADLWIRFGPTIEAANRPQVYGNPLEGRDEPILTGMQADGDPSRSGEEDERGQSPDADVPAAPNAPVPTVTDQRPSASPISETARAKALALMSQAQATTPAHDPAAKHQRPKRRPHLPSESR